MSVCAGAVRLIAGHSITESSSSSLPPTHLCHAHMLGVASQSAPLLLFIGFTCVTLHVLPWESLMLPPLCLFQCEDGADFLLVMQAGCRRHHFPQEEGLFLPLGTKYTNLPNIFMEPNLISACQENISPHALHPSLSLFIVKTHFYFPDIFYPLKQDDSTLYFKSFCFLQVYSPHKHK